MIYYGKHSISSDDIKSVKKTLSSNFLTQGPIVDKFEKELSKKLSAKYTISCSTGTSALHLSCQALNLKKGDIVWTTPITFVASANAALLCGAKIDLIDIDKDNWNIDLFSLRKKLEKSKKKFYPKILIVVHLGGVSCDMEKLQKLSKKYKFKIIEDACHGIGGSFNNHKIGSCKYSDISTFSFHPVKNMTTGEGGAITTNSKKLYKYIKRLRHHGIERKNQYFYDVKNISNNYRLSDINCSLGLSQLQKLEKFVSYRKKVADYYDKEIKSKTIIKREVNNKSNSGHHLYIIRSTKIKNLKDKEKIFKIFKKNNIILGFHYIPMYFFSIFKKKFNPKKFPESNLYYFQAFSLPIFFNLSLNDQKKVINLVNRYL